MILTKIKTTGPIKGAQMSSTPDTVLIITEQLDPHADAVLDQVERHGCRVFRLNTEDLLSDYSFEWRPDSGLLLCDRVGRELNQTRIRAAYLRKPKPVRPREVVGDIGVATLIESESKWFLQALYGLPINWVNNYWANQRGQTKLAQLELARSIGLTIPPTIVTNKVYEAKAFVATHNHEVLCKTFLNTGVKIRGEYGSIFAHKLSTLESESEIDRVAAAPVILQAYVEKKYEVRLTVMGQRIFACAIYSQTNDDTKIDWRVDPFSCEHEMIEPPPEIAEKCRELVRRGGLQFSTMDFIVSTNSEWVFLENNPNGQWLWMEIVTGAPMAAAMADLLLREPAPA